MLIAKTRLFSVALTALALCLVGCDFSESTQDTRFVAVNSSQQAAFISGESLDAVSKQWRPIEDEVSPGEEVLLRKVGVSNDFEISDLFRDLIVRSSGGEPVDAMRDELWEENQNAEGSNAYRLDIGPLLSQE